MTFLNFSMPIESCPVLFTTHLNQHHWGKQKLSACIW